MDCHRRSTSTCSLLALALVTACGPKSGGGNETGTEGMSGSDETVGDETATDENADGGSSDGGPGVSQRAVDILFVIDNSGSMGEEQGYLAQGIEGLVSTLDGAIPPVDYRVAVTTTDNGNPWCQGTTPEAGALLATSCLSRPSDFVFQGATMIDVFDEACGAHCELADLGLSDPWVDVPNASGGGLPDEEISSILQCMLPQGINGCGFENQLESLHQAILRTETSTDEAFGFRRDGALLAVLVLTDEADCSHDPSWETIFLPEGNRVFWSDPDAPAPSSAVCWNAGVTCEGAGTYESCTSTNLDVDGIETTPENAVLFPIDRYISQLADADAFIMAINGVNSDGSITYQDSITDPQFQSDFGIGPGCSSTAGRAVPPVRLHEVIEAVSGSGNERSVCDASYAASLSTFGSEILARLPPS